MSVDEEKKNKIVGNNMTRFSVCTIQSQKSTIAF